MKYVILFFSRKVMEISFKPILIYKRAFSYIFFLSCLNFIICFDDIELDFTLNNDIIELDSFYIINKIIGKKTKANKDSSNDLLGIFEASNDITFFDALPIAIIKEENIINDENLEEISININHLLHINIFVILVKINCI